MLICCYGGGSDLKVSTGCGIYHYSSHSAVKGMGRRDGTLIDTRKPDDGKEIHLFFICDAEGEFDENFASIANKTVLDACKAFYEKTGFENVKDYHQVINDILKAANKALYEKEQTEAVEMGASLTVAIIEGRKLHVGHIGNCRVYLYRDNRLDQITVDQSLVIRFRKGYRKKNRH
jgi:serine/threonine protein phosphatase PrpC